MADEKTSILLSDVSIEGDLVEKDRIIPIIKIIKIPKSVNLSMSLHQLFIITFIIY